MAGARRERAADCLARRFPPTDLEAERAVSRLNFPFISQCARDMPESSELARVTLWHCCHAAPWHKIRAWLNEVFQMYDVFALDLALCHHACVTVTAITAEIG